MLPKVELALNGSRYNLTFDLGSWSAIRRRGEKIVDVLGRFDADPQDFDALQTILYGMCWDNPTPPSFEDIGRLVNYENLSDVRAKILQVMKESVPKAEASEEPRPTSSGTPRPTSGSDTAVSVSSPASSGG